jgi:hypothetical protein
MSGEGRAVISNIARGRPQMAIDHMWFKPAMELALARLDASQALQIHYVCAPMGMGVGVRLTGQGCPVYICGADGGRYDNYHLLDMSFATVTRPYSQRIIAA